jgi:hypothetical protein
VPLAVDGDVSIAAGETVLFWLSYSSEKVDSSKFTVDGFRTAVGADAATKVVRVTGQLGMANGGDRGVRILDADGIVSWSHYPAGSMGQGQAVHFRPALDAADLGMDVLAPNAAPTPGVIDPATLVRPTPEPSRFPNPDPPPTGRSSSPKSRRTTRASTTSSSSRCTTPRTSPSTWPQRATASPTAPSLPTTCRRTSRSPPRRTS